MNEAAVSFAKIMCEEAKGNEEFARNHPQASEALKLSVNLWNYAFDVETRIKHLMTIPLTLLHVIQPQIYGLIYNFLLGNLPACYMSMRIILEGTLDAVVAHARFYDHPFPEDLNRLRLFEQKKSLSFVDKCELFLPAQIEKETIEEIKELWHYLSKYWVHAKGIVRKISEQTIQKNTGKAPPMWALALPYTYDEDDVDDINEYVTKLCKLKKVVEELLEPFSKAESN